MLVEHTIEIDADPAIVWKVSTDIDRWPEWTPTVRSARRLEQTPFGQGSTAKLKQPGMPPAVWRVTRWEPGRSFTWETGVPGLRLAATPRLEPGGECTINSLTLEASGLLAFVLSPVLRRSASRALSRENEGLKAVCEATARTSPPG